MDKHVKKKFELLSGIPLVDVKGLFHFPGYNDDPIHKLDIQLILASLNHAVYNRLTSPNLEVSNG
jgi:hypothetical protein